MRQGKKPLIIGVIVGLLVGVVLGAVLAASVNLRYAHRPPHLPNMVTVAVANQAIEAGTVLTYELLAQRDVPDQFVTSSVVRPTESMQLIGKPLSVDMQQGDPLLWSHVSDGQARSAPSGEDAQREAVSSDSGG